MALRRVHDVSAEGGAPDYDAGLLNRISGDAGLGGTAGTGTPRRRGRRRSTETAFAENRVGVEWRRRRTTHACFGRGRMNKVQIAERLAGRMGLSKSAAAGAVEAVFETIGEALAKDEDVRIAGFGTFTTKSRPARLGRNPGTGEAVSIAASTAPAFKAGKALKDAVNRALTSGTIDRVGRCEGASRRVAALTPAKSGPATRVERVAWWVVAGGVRGRTPPADDRMRFRGAGALTREEAMTDGNRELLIALDGHVAGKSMREIAEDLYGAERVAAEWRSDSVLRARTRRLLSKAQSHAKQG